MEGYERGHPARKYLSNEVILCGQDARAPSFFDVFELEGKFL
jgi:hypothetical protein